MCVILKNRKSCSQKVVNEKKIDRLEATATTWVCSMISFPSTLICSKKCKQKKYGKQILVFKPYLFTIFFCLHFLLHTTVLGKESAAHKLRWLLLLLQVSFFRYTNPSWSFLTGEPKHWSSTSSANSTCSAFTSLSSRDKLKVTRNNLAVPEPDHVELVFLGNLKIVLNWSF